MSLKTLELRNEREVWWCLYTQVRVQNVVKSKHGIKKKKKNQSLHLKRERERESAMTFPKEGKSQLRLGEHYPVVGEHVHEKKK